VATVNFSVPPDIKQAFDKAFKGANKSAVLSDLMRQAIEEQKKKATRTAVIAEILKLRKTSKPIRSSVIQTARRKGRP
jgi:metal-responsive CopG/Arc/MetJ family transcriptional regulator